MMLLKGRKNPNYSYLVRVILDYMFWPYNEKALKQVILGTLAEFIKAHRTFPNAIEKNPYSH